VRDHAFVEFSNAKGVFASPSSKDFRLRHNLTVHFPVAIDDSDNGG
jgi:hypothetical protein